MAGSKSTIITPTTTDGQADPLANSASLIRTLKSPGLSSSDKVILAQQAWHKHDLYVPAKREVLLDWLVSIMVPAGGTAPVKGKGKGKETSSVGAPFFFCSLSQPGSTPYPLGLGLGQVIQSSSDKQYVITDHGFSYVEFYIPARRTCLPFSLFSTGSCSMNCFLPRTPHPLHPRPPCPLVFRYSYPSAFVRSRACQVLPQLP